MEIRVMRLNLKTILKWSPEEAEEFLARWRWLDGIICPKCGAQGAWTINRTEKNGHQRKVYKCKTCRRQFSATVGTIFEDSHISLDKWIGAMFLLVSSKKGISARQLHRMLWDSTNPGAYRSAWFMVHRIREAMLDKEPGILSGVVEADETYIGPKTRRNSPPFRDSNPTHLDRREGRAPKFQPVGGKQVVFGMVERGGRVRTKHIGADRNPKADVVKPIMRENIDFANT